MDLKHDEFCEVEHVVLAKLSMFPIKLPVYYIKLSIILYNILITLPRTLIILLKALIVLYNMYKIHKIGLELSVLSSKNSILISHFIYIF